MKRVLIVGATSAIAEACARIWADQGCKFALVGRNAMRLGQIAADLRLRGAASADIHVMDAIDFASHRPMIETCIGILGPVDVVLLAHGTLPDQPQCELDASVALREFENNASSTVGLMTLLASVLESQGHGTLAVISSVAGDRGRSSNALYGAAKAAVTAYCSGLRARLHHRGINVLTIKPGFVDTPMTRGLALPRALVATPETVARRIVLAIERGASVVYAPMFWFWIMLVIRMIPEALFKRLRL